MIWLLRQGGEIWRCSILGRTLVRFSLNGRQICVIKGDKERVWELCHAQGGSHPIQRFTMPWYSHQPKPRLMKKTHFGHDGKSRPRPAYPVTPNIFCHIENWFTKPPTAPLPSSSPPLLVDGPNMWCSYGSQTDRGTVGHRARGGGTRSVVNLSASSTKDEEPPQLPPVSTGESPAPNEPHPRRNSSLQTDTRTCSHARGARVYRLNRTTLQMFVLVDWFILQWK